MAWAGLSLGCTKLGPALSLGWPRLGLALGLGQPRAWAVLGLGNSQLHLLSVFALLNQPSLFVLFSLQNLAQLKETIIVVAKFFALQNLCKAGALEWCVSKRSKKVMLMQKIVAKLKIFSPSTIKSMQYGLLHKKSFVCFSLF